MQIILGIESGDTSDFVGIPLHVSANFLFF